MFALIVCLKVSGLSFSERVVNLLEGMRWDGIILQVLQRGEAKQRQKAFKVSLVTFFWADAFGGASYAHAKSSQPFLSLTLPFYLIICVHFTTTPIHPHNSYFYVQCWVFSNSDSRHCTTLPQPNFSSEVVGLNRWAIYPTAWCLTDENHGLGEIWQ